jgi:hypothetical protein
MKRFEKWDDAVREAEKRSKTLGERVGIWIPPLVTIQNRKQKNRIMAGFYIVTSLGFDLVTNGIEKGWPLVAIISIADRVTGKDEVWMGGDYQLGLHVEDFGEWNRNYR